VGSPPTRLTAEGGAVTRDAAAEGTRRAPIDPEVNRGFGYHIDDWERIRAGDADHLIYLPEDEELLHEEAFVVVHPEYVCILERHR
jgi:hypothetical protein